MSTKRAQAIIRPTKEKPLARIYKHRVGDSGGVIETWYDGSLIDETTFVWSSKQNPLDGTGTLSGDY